MSRDRVIPLAEARDDYQPSSRKRPRPRATVLSSDPDWLHDGLTMRLTVLGQPVDLFSIGIMGRAMGRSTETVRRMIRQGVLPDARYRTRGRGVVGQKRLWTREDVLDAAEAVEALGLSEHRPRRWANSDLSRRLAGTGVTA